MDAALTVPFACIEMRIFAHLIWVPCSTSENRKNPTGADSSPYMEVLEEDAVEKYPGSIALSRVMACKSQRVVQV